MPNKFVFIIEAQDTKQVKNEMEKIEQSVQNAWLELADITKVPRELVDDYWNFSWAAILYDEGYEKAHSNAQKLLAAIKLKPRKIRKSQKGEKCPLCGENSVWKNDFGADKQEKLCGVCAIKRLLPESSIPNEHALHKSLSRLKYPSTTEISARKYIKKLNLSEKEIDDLHETKETDIKKKYGELLSNQDRYYALLTMDGDKMGDMIKKKTTPQAHLELSEQLDAFTKATGELKCFSEKHTKLIYAGGDDVFAVLPLENAINVAKEIRDIFVEKVKDATISAAIVIAHHKEPLREVIRDSHSVLDKIAKEKASRDALAIRLKKRSGGDRDLFFQWKATNPFKPDETLFESLFKVQEALSESALTSSLIYRLAQLKSPLAVEGIKSDQILKLFEYEVAHSIGEENVGDSAKRLAGICLANAFEKGALKPSKKREFIPEAAVIAHFLVLDKDDKTKDKQ
ncbi:MAG: type III-B CRISPR-associated protein Cas10/Cmr2 [Helicobacteraceae bacterium]|nr:type III-B CRISPR-associated protein Cas10/Cmr2 [Helicobacteraceae bacterium]